MTLISSIKMKDRLDLPSLPAEQIAKRIGDLMNGGDYSAIVTLTSGAQVFGDFDYWFKQFSGTCDDAAQQGLFMPKKFEEYAPGARYAYKLLPIYLVFNSSVGHTNGSAYVMVIPAELVADIRALVWSEETLGGQCVKNIPNPYATIIYRNNVSVAEEAGLETGELIELALSREAVGKGINFVADEMIYADWEFLQRISSNASLTAGILGIGLSATRSPLQLAYNKLRQTIYTKIDDWLYTENPTADVCLRGVITLPAEEVITTLEGEECILSLCSNEKPVDQGSSFIPVLMKKKAISYPYEFFPFIESELTFYGEVKQIPMLIGKLQASRVLLARAIGYVAPRT